MRPYKRWGQRPAARRQYPHLPIHGTGIARIRIPTGPGRGWRCTSIASPITRSVNCSARSITLSPCSPCSPRFLRAENQRNVNAPALRVWPWQRTAPASTMVRRVECGFPTEFAIRAKQHRTAGPWAGPRQQPAANAIAPGRAAASLTPARPPCTARVAPMTQSTRTVTPDESDIRGRRVALTVRLGDGHDRPSQDRPPPLASKVAHRLRSGREADEPAAPR